LIHFPVSTSQTLTWLSRLLDGASVPPRFISTDTTPSWWPLRVCRSCNFSPVHFHILTRSSMPPVMMFSDRSLSLCSHAQCKFYKFISKRRIISLRHSSILPQIWVNLMALYFWFSSDSSFSFTFFGFPTFSTWASLKRLD
jgi:hypothetical protein